MDGAEYTRTTETRVTASALHTSDRLNDSATMAPAGQAAADKH